GVANYRAKSLHGRLARALLRSGSVRRNPAGHNLACLGGAPIMFTRLSVHSSQPGALRDTSLREISLRNDSLSDASGGRLLPPSGARARAYLVLIVYLCILASALACGSPL